MPCYIKNREHIGNCSNLGTLTAFIENNLDGLQYTKVWLTRNADKLQFDQVDHNASTGATNTAGAMSAVTTASHQATPGAILNTAYTELLDWDDRHTFPEVV